MANDVETAVDIATDTLEDLTRRGFVTRLPGAETSYGLAPPERTLPSLVRKKETEIEMSREAIQSIVDRYHSAGGPAPEAAVEVVVGAEAAIAQISGLQARAQTEVLGFVKAPFYSLDNEGEAEALQRGVANRWLWERAAFEMPGMLELARRYHDAGERMRVVPEVPSKLVIIDRKVAVIHIRESTAGHSIVGALSTRHPELVSTFLQLFELLWSAGISPFEPSAGGFTDSTSDVERLVACLAAGMTDAAVARDLGISRRTLTRRIQELMDSLNVSNRFQARLSSRATDPRGRQRERWRRSVVAHSGHGPGQVNGPPGPKPWRMTRRVLRRTHAFGLSGLAALLACALLVPPSTAATTVPDTVQVTDPAGDANYVNDQGFGGTVGSQGDHGGAASFAPGDILDVWFTNTADSVSLHIHTSAPAPSEETGLMFRVTANPAPPAQGCLWFEASIPSLTYSGDATATVENPCSASGKLAGELALEALPDGTGVATLTFAQSLLPELAAGEVISAPLATTRHLSGKSGVAGPTAPQIDNTKPGSDYEILVVAPSPSTTVKKCRRLRRPRCRR